MHLNKRLQEAQSTIAHTCSWVYCLYWRPTDLFHLDTRTLWDHHAFGTATLLCYCEKRHCHSLFRSIGDEIRQSLFGTRPRFISARPNDQGSLLISKFTSYLANWSYSIMQMGSRSHTVCQAGRNPIMLRMTCQHQRTWSLKQSHHILHSPLVCNLQTRHNHSENHLNSCQQVWYSQLNQSHPFR